MLVEVCVLLAEVCVLPAKRSDPKSHSGPIRAARWASSSPGSSEKGGGTDLSFRSVLGHVPTVKELCRASSRNIDGSSPASAVGCASRAAAFAPTGPASCAVTPPRPGAVRPWKIGANWTAAVEIVRSPRAPRPAGSVWEAPCRGRFSPSGSILWASSPPTRGAGIGASRGGTAAPCPSTPGQSEAADSREILQRFLPQWTRSADAAISMAGMPPDGARAAFPPPGLGRSAPSDR